MKEEGEGNTEFNKVSKHSCLNGVYGQPSNGLKIDRQQSEKVIFYRQRSKMQVKINSQQALKYVKCHYFSCSLRHSGRVGSPDPPIRPEACLRLKFLHRLADFFQCMERALDSATKLNSRDIQKCNCFWVPSYDLFTSACKAVFPSPTATGVHRLRNTWSSL